MSDAIIQVQDVTIRHDTDALLEHVTFEVARGEIGIILGASGCGKSTLLKHIIGLHAPAEGDVLIEGESIVQGDDATRKRIMQRIGVLYQAGALFGSMTLQQNVALPLEEHTALPPALIAQLARRKLAAVGLAGFEDYLPGTVSGGMKKRAGLARALALNPPLLFLDEPSAGLDPISSAGLDRLILELRDRFGVTLLVVTHELDSIFAIGDRAIILKDKRILADAPVQELRYDASDPWIAEFFSRSGTKK